MKRHFLPLMFIGFLAFLCTHPAAYGGTKTTHEETVPQSPTARMPEMIYVADFELDVSDVQSEGGVLGSRTGPRGGVLRGAGPLHRNQNPADKARELVDLLSSSLTKELTNSSLPALRLLPGTPLPRKGWLIQGQFDEVDEGNRLRRAVIGFGAGGTDMEIEVQAVDLSIDPETPFLTLGTQSGSMKTPGAIVFLNPYVAAAKFVLSKNASEKDVQHAASQIASEIVNYMKAQGLLPP